MRTNLPIGYETLKNASFPVYKLPDIDYQVQDGIIWLNGKVLDDRNIKHEKLGVRRLNTPFNDELVPLTTACMDFVSIIKQPHKYFIDSLGKIFEYEKSKFCDIIYHKIEDVEKRDILCRLKLQGCPKRLQAPRPPPPDAEYAGVLYLDGYPWKLFEYAETKQKKRKKKI